MVEAARLGCADCAGEDALAAWLATRARALGVLQQEPHFSLRLVACACGQAFVQVFTERVDWVAGEDPQEWVLVPLTEAERAAFEQSPSTAAVEALSRGRRCLARSYPSGGEITVAWQPGPVTVGPHD